MRLTQGRAVVGLLLLALMAVSAGAAWFHFSRPAEPGARAQGAYDARDWETAATLSRDLARTSPRDTSSLKLLARSSARLGRDDVARNLYSRLDPSLRGAEDLFLIGRIIERTGDLNVAIKSYELALNADPDHPESLAALAEVNRRSGHLGTALAFADRLSSRPGWSAFGHALAGDLHAELHDPASATTAYQKARAVNETPAPGARELVQPGRALSASLARVLLKQGKAAEATAALSAAGLAPGQDAEADWLFSRSALATGDATNPVHEAAASYRAAHPGETEPAPYAGAASCSGCHSGISKALAGSHHAKTFHRASELSLADPGLAPVPDPMADPADPARVKHSLRKTAHGLDFDTQVDGQTVRAVVDYAFGSGDRGLTLVGHDDQGRSRELRLSRYAEMNGWDVTNGQDAHPSPADRYLGKLLTADLTRRCLDCHTTDARAARLKTGPTATDHAIGCERCHGPGGHHAMAVDQGLPDLAIAAGKGKMSAAEAVALCAQCHGVRGMTPKPDNPFSVRFQADTLTWSRCYKESDGGLSCLTCHDPHRDAETAPAYYETKCLNCHGESRSTSTRACPVNPKRDCISCHMPVDRNKVVPHTRFTDHYIRVHRD